jgi:hypothetical protein
LAALATAAPNEEVRGSPAPRRDGARRPGANHLIHFPNALKTPGRAYLLADASWVPTKLKIEFNCVPSVMTAATIATEIPAAISPYSMAVVADSSVTKRSTSPFMCLLPEMRPRWQTHAICCGEGDSITDPLQNDWFRLDDLL